jgi:hypothetical protein
MDEVVLKIAGKKHYPKSGGWPVKAFADMGVSQREHKNLWGDVASVAEGR